MRTLPGETIAPATQALPAHGVLAGEWVLDLRRSSVRLASRVLGFVPVRGEFREVSGSGSVSAGGEVSGIVTVAAASVDTRNARRDAHLRSADFFDSDTSPDITFTVASIRPAGQGVTVTGALAVRGRSLPLSFDATAAASDAASDDGGAGLDGGAGYPAEVRLDATVRINRADLGLTWNVLGMASMSNSLTIHCVFARPALSPRQAGTPGE
ncbi:MAG: YceI family protein [Streptosporangiaceae bacterium]